MNLGMNKIIVLIFIILINIELKAEDKITSVPLINLEKLKPSFEEVSTSEIENEIKNNNEIKNKNKKIVIVIK